MKGLEFSGRKCEINGESRIWNEETTGQSYPAENCTNLTELAEFILKNFNPYQARTNRFMTFSKAYEVIFNQSLKERLQVLTVEYSGCESLVTELSIYGYEGCESLETLLREIEND